MSFLPAVAAPWWHRCSMRWFPPEFQIGSEVGSAPNSAPPSSTPHSFSLFYSCPELKLTGTGVSGMCLFSASSFPQLTTSFPEGLYFPSCLSEIALRHIFLLFFFFLLHRLFAHPCHRKEEKYDIVEQ